MKASEYKDYTTRLRELGKYNYEDLHLEEVYKKFEDWSKVADDGEFLELTYEGRRICFDFVTISTIAIRKIEFRFYNCLFPLSVCLDKQTLSSISFSSSFFLKSFTVNNASVAFLELNDCKLFGITQIFSSRIDYLRITSSFSKLQVKDWNGLDFRIFKETESNIFISDFWLEVDNSKGRIEFDGIQVGKFTLYGDMPSGLKLVIKNVSCPRFSISNCVSHGRLVVHKLNSTTSFNDWKSFEEYLLGVTNNKSNVSKLVNTAFILNDCLLDNCIFSNIDFKNYKYISINSSLISKSIFSACDFESIDKQLRAINSEVNFVEVNLEERQEIFRQLKNSFSQQNDFIKSEFFHALEMSTFSKRVSARKRLGLWLVLKFSQWTSSYGTSIRRPIFAMVVLNLFPFYLLLSSGAINGLTNEFDFSLLGIEAAIGEFLKLINPFRTYNNSLQGFQIFWDFLIRIISSYCIFNFIRASRRFVK